MTSLDLLPRKSNTARLRAEFTTAAIVCALLVVAVYLLEYQRVSGGLYSESKLFNQFNLGHENNFAAWFSGALLAVLALHAMDGHSLFRSVSHRVARAWVMIAGVLIFLSVDEIGSLHERLSGLGKTIGAGSWGLLLPLGAVLAGVLLWAMAVLWQYGGAQRKQAIILMAGFALLGSVAVQEFLEHALTWETAHARATRLAVEEGCELLGMLILLRVIMNNSVGLLAGRYGPSTPMFEVLWTHRRGLLIALIVLTPFITLLTLGLQDRGRGRPADWLAAMAFLAAAAVVASGWLQGRKSHTALVAIGLLLALSCACVAIPPGALFETGIMPTTRKAVILIVLTATVLVVCGWVGAFGRSHVRLAIFTMICTALFVLSADSRGLTFLLTIALGAVTYRAVSQEQIPDPVLGKAVQPHLRMN